MPKPSKSARILISLPDPFLEEVDQIAADEMRSRSELIREALRLYLRDTDAVPAETLNAVE